MADHVSLGFLPLLDSAILVAAKELDFAADQNIDLSLVKETSWAAIRDRMAVGHFDAAHMLAPMPIAANLGLTQMPVKLIAPMALGLGGNAVTVSLELARRLADRGLSDRPDAAKAGTALLTVIEQRRIEGLPPLRFGIVHPYSGHNMELRYWLAASGIDPDNDVTLVIVPPPFMPDALESDQLDGYCVGEPWNSVAVDKGIGEILTVKSNIWRSSPEKILAVQLSYAEEKPDRTARLLRALYAAAQWCGEPDNHEYLAKILSRDTYLGLDQEIIMRGLSGAIRLDQATKTRIEDFFQPFARAATFPWQSHALWFYSQLVRWKMAVHEEKNAAIAKASYRPDIYREALEPLGVNVPNANAKVEGALLQPTAVGVMHETLLLGPDGFFDGAIFDPDKLDSYILKQQATENLN